MKEKLLQITETSDPHGQLSFLESITEQTREIYMEKLRENAPESLSCFAEYMNPEEPPAELHEFFIAHLEAMERRELMRFMLSVPPGHAKSTYASHLFPAWYLGRNPTHKYLQAGHTQTFVESEYGKRVRAIVQSDKYRDVFPEIQLSTDTKAAALWGLDNGKGRYVARGVGQGISGFRGNIAGVDDSFASREAAESPAERDRVYNWFHADFASRLLPNSPLFVVATRWHMDDLCGRIERDSKQGKGIPYVVINLPVLCEDEDDAMGRKMGQRLWDFFPMEFILDKKATLPPRDWNSLYRGKPTLEEGEIVNQGWFKRYDRVPTDKLDGQGNLLEKGVRRVVVSVDSANKVTERSDFTVLTVWVEDLVGNHYLKQVVRKRVEFPGLVALIHATARVHNADLILIEEAASGVQYLQAHAEFAPCDVIGIPTSNKTKQMRFDATAMLFQAGLVYLPHVADWLAEYEAEIIAFPSAKYRDQADSTSQYLDFSRKKRRLGTKKLHGTS